MIVTALPWVATAAFALLVPFVAGLAGLAYAPFWVLAAVPGVPLGLRLTRRRPAGWIVGLAIGYATSCLLIWALIEIGVMAGGTLTIAWTLETALYWLLSRRIQRPAVDLPAWTRRETAGLSASLLLVPLLMAAPYHNLGGADTAGTTHYRAYFTADFVWHVALTEELRRFEMPPRNPYMEREALHYYWTYFLVPAAVSSLAPSPVHDVEADLKVNAIATAALLVSAFFLFAWATGGGAVPAAVAVVLVVLASSAEGLIAIKDLVDRGLPLSELRNTNVDAITAWKYNGLRIDGVHRTMFYTPQHGLSCTLGLLALLPAMLGSAAATWRSTLTTGVLLGLATTLNPFLGGAFSLIYGLAILIDTIRMPLSPLRLLPHVAAAVPPACAVLWGVLNSMGEGAGSAVTIGWVGFARNRPVLTLLMSAGPVLLPALAGFLPSRRLPSMPALVAGCGLLVGLGLLYFVVLSEASWVGFRAGQILLAMTTVPLARLFSWLWEPSLVASPRWRRGAGMALFSGILVIGLPTVAVDTFNAADTGNLAPGPGFPWTLTVSPSQQQALAWVRAHTPPAAVVQMDTLARGRGHWSFIPTFAARRMAAGLPISLLPRPEYDEASAAVRRIFDASDAGLAHDTARRLRIDYLWVDTYERGAYPAGTALLAASSAYFEPVFDNGEVTVYRVR